MQMKNDPLFKVDIINEFQKHRPAIEKSLKWLDGTHCVEDLLAMVFNTKLQFWFNDEACIFTEVIDYPRARHVNLFLTCGKLKAARLLEPDIEEFARKINATRLIGPGRDGWSRVAGRGNWRRKGVLMVKDL